MRRREEGAASRFCLALSLCALSGALAVADGRGGARLGSAGSGLPGLRDRLHVLGGGHTVTGGDGRTRVRSALPCG